MGQQHSVLSLSKEKTVALNVQSFRSEFKRTGKAVGVILEAFKIFSSPLFFSGIFTLSSAAPGAIHYCVKVLVLCFGLEA